MRTLHLVLTKQWFDMILSGEKKEEYRRIKPYWNIRLLHKSFDTVTFSHGYSKKRRQMVVEFKGLQEGLGIEKWGAPLGERVHIIKLGKLLNKNC